MKRFILCPVFILLLFFSIPGTDLGGSVPDYEKLNLIRGKWETMEGGAPRIFYFTDQAVGSDKTSFMFFILKPGEQLNSRMQYSVYSLRRDNKNRKYIILDFKQAGVPDLREICEVEFSPHELIFREINTMGIRILERHRDPKGGKDEEQ